MKRTFTKYPATTVTASDTTNIDKVKSAVSEKLKARLQELLVNHEDNLAIAMASEVSNYNPDWCAEDLSDDYDSQLESIIDDLVKLEVSSLFKNVMG